MSVEIEPGALIGLVVTSVIFPLMFFGLLLGRLRSPEFRLRLKRKKWLYAIVKDRLGELREHIISIGSIEGTNNSFKIGKGTYFWRTQDLQGRQTVFPYKKKLAAIYKRGIPMPEAFANESMAALGGYTSEEFTTILESEVERNIVEAMKPRNSPVIIIAIIAIITLGAVIYMAISLGNLTDALHHTATAATAASNSTGTRPPIA